MPGSKTMATDPRGSVSPFYKTSRAKGQGPQTIIRYAKTATNANIRPPERTAILFTAETLLLD